MELITGASLILSLIPFWQRERDKQETAKKEEFYAWLLEHKFQDVKDCITNNHSLEVQIEELLSQNQKELLNRFDTIDENLFRILYNIDEFRNFAKVIAPNMVLSEQSKKLLKAFVESKARKMKFICPDQGGYILFFDFNNSNLEFDQRFIEDNLKQLVEAGYILHAEKLSYNLSESALEYVNNLKKNEPSSEAVNILKQMVDSKKVDFNLSETCDNTTLDINGASPISLVAFNEKHQMFLDELVSNEFVNKNGNRYTLQKAGSDYIRNNY